MNRFAKIWDLFYFSILIIIMGVLYRDALNNPLVFDSTSLTNQFTHTFAVHSPFQIRWLSNITFWHFDSSNLTMLKFHRAANVILHVLNTFLVYIFSFRLCTKFSPKNFQNFQIIRLYSALASLIYLISATQTYAVAYLIQRSIILGTFFILLSLVSFIQLLEQINDKTTHSKFKTVFFSTVSILTYYLATVSKEHVSVILVYYFVLDYFYSNGLKNIFTKKSSLLRILFYTTLTFIFIQILYHQSLDVFTAYESHAQIYLEDLQNQTQHIPILALNFINQSKLFYEYLLLFLVPWTSMMSIDIHLPFPTQILQFPDILFAMLHIAIFVLILFLRNTRNFIGQLTSISLAGIWIAFLTELSVVRITEPFVLYRSYFWMVFIIPLLSAILISLSQRIKFKALILILIFPILISQAVATKNRLETFKSIQALWKDTITKLDKSAPGSYRSLNSYGMSIASEGNYQEALTFIDESILRNPYYPLSYYNKAYCHQFLHQPDLAIENYKKAISLNPQYADAYNNLGTIHIEKGDFKQALDDLLKSDQINPINFKTKNNLGALYDRQDQPEKSIYYYEQGLRINPADAATLNNLGLVYLKQNKFDQAIDYFKQSAEIDSQFQTAKINWGIACYKKEDYSCALAKLSVTLAPHSKKDPMSLFYLANTYGALNQTDRAIELFNQLLKLDPMNSVAHYNIGVLYLKNHQMNPAIEHFGQCLKQDPQDQNCIKALTILKTKLN